MKWEGKNVLVMGLAKSGLAAVHLLIKHKAQVTVYDEKKPSELKRELKDLPETVVRWLGKKRAPKKRFDLVVTSPGVPWNHRDLINFRKRGVAVWPELELGWRMVRPKKTVAITGTNGKTTTTTLIGHLLKTAGRPVVVGGNIGTPLSALIQKVTDQTVLILEVSSYQLEGHSSFHPNVGLFLNLTPDHIQRHPTMSRYASAKARLFEFFDHADTAVLNGKDPWCRRVGRKISGRKVWFPNKDLLSMASHITLPGEHNLQNAMAAVAAAQALGLKSKDIIRGLETFKGVPHRIQIVRTLRGVTYVNDSKSTNVDSTLVAIKAFKKPLVLILGGRDKGAPYAPLIPFIKKNVKEILTIGEASSKIAKELKGVVPVRSSYTLDNAVKMAYENCVPGDIVLLSPACASFDQYRNFEHRGDSFIQIVKRLRA